MHRSAFTFLAVAIALPGADWEWNLPNGFPRPAVPADNPMSVPKVELGRYLFYDKRMSVNPCCHAARRGDHCYFAGKNCEVLIASALRSGAKITGHFVRLATVAHTLLRATSALAPTPGLCGVKTCRDESRHGTHERVRHEGSCEVILAPILSCLPHGFLFRKQLR